MKLNSHPVLKFRTGERLHISKEIGLFSWAAFLTISLFGILVDYYVIPDYFLLHAGFISMCLVLSLNLIKTWDLIMDRDENLGTMIYRSWYHVFSIRVPEENVERFPLTAVASVILISDSVIEIKKRNGSSTKIISELSDYESLKKLRKQISSFLCLERIEYLENTEKIFYDWDMEPWISSLETTENQDSDNESQENNSVQEVQEESQSQPGNNIKTITGFF